jgi:hypothetical protein
MITDAMRRPEIHELRGWKSLRPDHGNRRCTPPSDRDTSVLGKEGGPREEGSGLRPVSPLMLDVLLVPRDARGIVLLCGFVMAAALGIGALLVGDPIAYALLAAAAIGYLFLQTRILPALIFLAVAVYGAAGGLAGAPVDWVECGVAVLLTLVALFPVPAVYRDESGEAPRDPRTTLAPASIASNGETSALLEVSPARTSAFLEDSVAANNGLKHRLVIQSIGRLRLLLGTRDLATDLEAKPVLAFMWKYLLARAASRAAHVSREAFGDELSPGMSKATQRERLRKQLYDLQNDVEPSVAAVVRTNRSDVWLDLEDTDFDIAALRQLGERIRQRGFLIDAQLAAACRRRRGRRVDRSGRWSASLDAACWGIRSGSQGSSRTCLQEVRHRSCPQRGRLPTSTTRCCRECPLDAEWGPALWCDHELRSEQWTGHRPWHLRHDGVVHLFRLSEKGHQLHYHLRRLPLMERPEPAADHDLGVELAPVSRRSHHVSRRL